LLREEFELREKLAATGLLAAGVAHEINNPIGMILNDLHFLKVVSKDERIQNRVGNLEKHFGFITEVISNLLSFSHERESENKAVEINSAVQELVRLLNHYVERNDSRLAFSPQAGELHAAINANELKQVLLNLIKNSIEAFTGGGTIRIETRESVVDGEQCAQVDVIDDGPGISADNMNDVFLPFKSAKKASNSNSGLGLSVSYSIVKKYNGQISVDSDNGRGCRFSLRFPMVRVASA
jgi:two-component system NtrC family sensor kinase